MSNNFVIRKNTIEIKTESMVLHRNNVSCILYKKSKDDETFHVYLWFRKPIEKHFGDKQYYEYVHVICDDYLPFVEWFDDEPFPDPSPLGETLVDLLYAKPTPESETQSKSSVVWHPCICCREQLASVCERPEFNNDFFCDVCYDAKTALASLDYKKTKEEKLLKGYVELNEDLTIEYELEDN